MIRVFVQILFTALLFPALTHAAGQPSFAFPVDCEPEENCWIVTYVDTDPKPDSAKDHRCGPRTYDDHKGTDIAIRDLAVMKKGVNVLAPMDGRVLRLRDGEDDTPKNREQLKKINEAKKSCGNGLILDHGPAGFQGLQTMYCHLKKGSIRVQKDQTVKQGQTIAQIGHSGETEFPHLHFGIIWEGGIIDPYTGALNTDGCGQFQRNMWEDKDEAAYQPISLYHGGITGEVPDFEAVKQGTAKPSKPTLDSQALLLWTGLYGVRKGDEVTLKLSAPYGRPFVERTNTLEEDRARQFFYSGRKIGEDNPLQRGTYTGEVTVKRAGKIIAEKTYTATIE